MFFIHYIYTISWMLLYLNIHNQKNSSIVSKTCMCPFAHSPSCPARRTDLQICFRILPENTVHNYFLKFIKLRYILHSKYFLSFSTYLSHTSCYFMKQAWKLSSVSFFSFKVMGVWTSRMDSRFYLLLWCRSWCSSKTSCVQKCCCCKVIRSWEHFSQQ